MSRTVYVFSALAAVCGSVAVLFVPMSLHLIFSTSGALLIVAFCQLMLAEQVGR